MRERRSAYDAQIASATTRKSEAVREERERENRRLEAVRRGLEEERAAGIFVYFLFSVLMRFILNSISIIDSFFKLPKCSVIERLPEFFF